MADEDRLINVIVKYSQENASQVATTSSELSKKDIDAWKQSNQAATDLAAVRAKAWQLGEEKATKSLENTAAVDEEVTKTMIGDWTVLGDSMKNITAAQMKNWEKLRPARMETTGEKPADAAGQPFDPKPVENYRQRLQETTKEFRSLRMAAREIGQLGAVFSMVGGVLTAGIVADANNYVKAMGKINEYSSQWMEYQQDIKKSNLEIGQVATQALVPAMKSAAEFMQQVASVLKQNPWMVQAALYVGGAMTAIGVALSVVSQVVRVISVIGLLMARLEKAQAEQAALAAEQAVANASGGYGGSEYLPGGAGSLVGSQAGALGTLGTVTLMATSVIIGAEIGSIIGNAIAKMIYGEGYKEQNIGDALMTLVKMFQIPMQALLQSLGKLSPGIAEFANSVFAAIRKVNEALGGMLGATEYKKSSPEDSQMILDQELQAFVNYQKQIADAQEQYSSQRKEIIAQYEQQVVDVTKQYEEQRAEAIASYNKQMARQEEDWARSRARSLENYNAQVAAILAKADADNITAVTKFREDEAKAQEQFNIESQRQAEAHALEMERLEQQHSSKLNDLASARDALGIVKENEAYATEVAQKEQDYQIQQAQRLEDFQQQQAERRQEFIQQEAERKADAAQQLADLKTDFENQEALATEDHDIQLARQKQDQAERLAKMDADHKEEMDKLKKQEDEKLAKLDEAHRKQMTALEKAMVDQLNAIDSTMLGMTAALKAEAERQLADFQSWINSHKSQSSTATSASTSGVNTGTGHQYGGYAVFEGKGETGRPEYVASGDTTRQLEGAIGSRLTQAGLLAAVMAGRNAQNGGGSRSMQIIVQARDLTISEIKNQIDSALNQKLGDLLPAFGA